MFAPARTSPLPAVILCSVLLGLSLLVWPHFLERWISLEWRVGDVRLAAYAVQALVVSAAVAVAVWRQQINTRVMAMFPSRRHAVFALVTTTLSLALAAAAAELICRLFDLPVRMRMPPAERVSTTFDAELGWAYRPNATVISTFGSDHRRIPSYFDEFGLRVRAPGVTHDPARPTMLFVGDSFTMGHGVTFEESFVGRLEARRDFPYQVVNLGVQAFGTDQSLLMLKRHVSRFNTKVVVYTFIDDHVARNANHDRRLLEMVAGVPGTKPLYGLTPDGALYLRKAPTALSGPPAARLPALLQIAWTRLGPRPSVPLTRALVREMRRVAEAHGARFLVLYWRGQAPEPDPRDDVLGSMDVDVLDVGTNAPSEWRTWTLPGDPHPDARAHARVAALLYSRFREGR